jgi:hypothetical protein
VPSLLHGAVELLAEVTGVGLVLFMALALASRASGDRADRRTVFAGGLTALLAISIVLHARSAGSQLAQAGRHHVSAQAGLDHCVTESLSGAPVALRAVGFLPWVKRALPADARYAVAPYVGSLDEWCLTSVLLPALPARPGEPFGWTVAVGSVPAEMQAKIARHDRNVRVYSPGYALERDPQP